MPLFHSQNHRLPELSEPVQIPHFTDGGEYHFTANRWFLPCEAANGQEGGRPVPGSPLCCWLSVSSYITKDSQNSRPLGVLLRPIPTFSYLLHPHTPSLTVHWVWGCSEGTKQYEVINFSLNSSIPMLPTVSN